MATEQPSSSSSPTPVKAWEVTDVTEIVETVEEEQQSKSLETGPCQNPEKAPSEAESSQLLDLLSLADSKADLKGLSKTDLIRLRVFARMLQGKVDVAFRDAGDEKTVPKSKPARAESADTRAQKAQVKQRSASNRCVQRILDSRSSQEPCDDTPHVRYVKGFDQYGNEVTFRSLDSKFFIPVDPHDDTQVSGVLQGRAGPIIRSERSRGGKPPCPAVGDCGHDVSVGNSRQTPLDHLRRKRQVPPKPLDTREIPCKFFAAGQCERGNTCRYKHSAPMASP